MTAKKEKDEDIVPMVPAALVNSEKHEHVHLAPDAASERVQMRSIDLSAVVKVLNHMAAHEEQLVKQVVEMATDAGKTARRAMRDRQEAWDETAETRVENRRLAARIAELEGKDSSATNPAHEQAVGVLSDIVADLAGLQRSESGGDASGDPEDAALDKLVSVVKGLSPDVQKKLMQRFMKDGAE